MDTGILLESGTNELEILEFTVGGNSYGINVAKVREILPYQVPTPVPNSDPRVEGIFMPRDEILSIIDLAVVMNLPKKADTVAYCISCTRSCRNSSHFLERNFETGFYGE